MFLGWPVEDGREHLSEGEKAGNKGEGVGGRKGGRRNRKENIIGWMEVHVMPLISPVSDLILASPLSKCLLYIVYDTVIGNHIKL